MHHTTELLIFGVWDASLGSFIALGELKRQAPPPPHTHRERDMYKHTCTCVHMHACTQHTFVCACITISCTPSPYTPGLCFLAAQRDSSWSSSSKWWAPHCCRTGHNATSSGGASGATPPLRLIASYHMPLMKHWISLR